MYCMLVRREEVAINHLVFFHILVFIATASFLWSVHTNKVPQVVTSRGQVQLVADDSCICVIPEGVAHRPKLAVETHLHPPLAAAAPPLSLTSPVSHVNRSGVSDWQNTPASFLCLHCWEAALPSGLYIMPSPSPKNASSVGIAPVG